MAVPVDLGAWSLADPDVDWARLNPAAKRERILCAAGAIFSRDGLAAPIPSVAAAAGAGIGSVYRRFPSKRDLLAALVTRRLEQTAAAADAATDRPGARWDALVDMLWTIVEDQSGDDFLGEAIVTVADHPDVIAAGETTAAAIERLVGAARSEGRLRPDATTRDIQLLFAATRAAKQVDPLSWRRMLSLLIDGLSAPASGRGVPSLLPAPGTGIL